MKRQAFSAVALFVVGGWMAIVAIAAQQDQAAAQRAEGVQTDGKAGAEAQKTPKPNADGTVSLTPDGAVTVDLKKKQVRAKGKVVLRSAPLEMFACPERTKEHESVVSVASKAYVIHAGLLRVGAKPGSPVQFRPEYKPASGQEIEITVEWTQDGEKKTARAQDWIKDSRTGKAMDVPFVFAGSGFWEDEQTGQKHYRAEEGDLVCVSNFTSAMIDVPVASDQANAALLFETFTERIPPVGTPVTLVFTPKADAKADKAKEAESK